MRICVDFDGTIVEHMCPEIGAPIPGAIRWLRKWQQAGAQLILWTCRSGDTLDAAVEYCRDQGIEFVSVNSQLDGDDEWTTSPKVYAVFYVDDAALGCPLVHNRGRRPYVDWSLAGPEGMRRIQNWKHAS